MNYRKDIDGLRAVAVVAVILFHLGFLRHGYLGVDIFFVISGFLITSIVYQESIKGEFSVWKFYERRLRRIIPLLLVISIVALVLGIYFMLPDDLENLSQSVIASNLSANNILMLITSADYWAVKNDYKPLMHTWSLGIEEQFYLLYPILFVLFTRQRLKLAKYALLLLAIVSIGLWSLSANESQKFYLIQYRFFELAIGGFCAIHFDTIKSVRVTHKAMLYVALVLLFLLLLVPLGSNDLKVLLTTAVTALVLVLGRFFVGNDKVYQTVMTNSIMVFIGLISYSLYMWHQVVFAFARYAWLDEITGYWALMLSILVIALSLLTYHTIEKVFRNRQNVSGRKLIISLVILLVTSTAPALYLYAIGGIYKDFPSVSLYAKDNASRPLNFFSARENVHNNYNEVIRALDRDFTDSNSVKMLVVGNSFGRDVANIVLESSISGQVELRYFDIKRAMQDKQLAKRLSQADYVLIGVNGFLGREWVAELEQFQGVHVAKEKLFVVGIKDFGHSNGIHYNRLNSISDFTNYYTPMKKGIGEKNVSLRNEWTDHYIDLVEVVQNERGEVLVFTPEGKFISQDTNHLTKNGAVYFAKRLEPILKRFVDKTYSF